MYSISPISGPTIESTSLGRAYAPGPCGVVRIIN